MFTVLKKGNASNSADLSETKDNKKVKIATTSLSSNKSISIHIDVGNSKEASVARQRRSRSNSMEDRDKNLHSASLVSLKQCFLSDEIQRIKSNCGRETGKKSISNGVLLFHKKKLLESFSCTNTRIVYGMFFMLVLLLGIFKLISFIQTRDPCMVADRYFDRLKSRLERSDDTLAEIQDLPKIIHQQWKSNTLPEGSVQAKWHAKWKELFPEPEYHHILWTDEMGLELIQKDFPWFLDVYKGYKFEIERVDAVRYFILYKYGGLYADMDYEPLVNFWEYIPKDRVSIVESPYLYNEYVQNSLMSSPKEDHFWRNVFKLLIVKAKLPVLQATGPNLLDSAIKDTSEPFGIFPCENFQRIPFQESANSPFLSRFHRELLGRVYPMKYCGDYNDHTCQFAKHHNTATYLEKTGLLHLLFVGN